MRFSQNERWHNQLRGCVTEKSAGSFAQAFIAFQKPNQRMSVYNVNHQAKSALIFNSAASSSCSVVSAT